MFNSTPMVASRREIYQLADAMIYVLSIPSGRELGTLLLGLGYDNRDAIAHWISEQLTRPDVELSRECMNVLLPRLRSMLEEKSGGVSW